MPGPVGGLTAIYRPLTCTKGVGPREGERDNETRRGGEKGKKRRRKSKDGEVKGGWRRKWGLGDLTPILILDLSLIHISEPTRPY